MALAFVGLYLFDLGLLVKLLKDGEDTFTFRRSRNKAALRISDGLMIAGIPMLFVELGMGLLIIATGMLFRGIIEMKSDNEKAYVAFIGNTNPRRLK